MNQQLIYLLESATCIIAFSWFYWLFLMKKNHFRFNRAFFLVSLCFSMIAPILNFSYQTIVSQKLYLYNVLDTIVITANGFKNYINKQPVDFLNWIWNIWISGCILFTIIFLYRLFRIFHLIGTSNRLKYKDYTVVEVPDSIAPSSFFHYIFLGKTGLPENDLKNIIAHERIHIRQKHSIDNLFFEIICIVQWFNPFIWWSHTRIREIHEFLADREVVRQGNDRLQYQYLLVNQAINPDLFLVSAFNNSLLKRRLIMLSKMEAPAKVWIKVVLLIPVIVLLIVAFSCSNQPKNEVVEKTVINDTVFDVVDVAPEYKGGIAALQKKLGKLVVYPENGKEMKITGKIYISFVIGKDGNLQDMKVVKGISEDYKPGNLASETDKARYQAALDMEKAALDAVSSLSGWSPGLKEGKPVSTRMTIPINFQLQ